MTESKQEQEVAGGLSSWFNDAISGMTSTLSSAMASTKETSGPSASGKMTGIFRSRLDPCPLTLEDWTGTWETEYQGRCRYGPVLRQLDPPIRQISHDEALSYQQVEKAGFTMDHEISALLFHSGLSGRDRRQFHIIAKLDGCSYDSPYPRRDQKDGDVPLTWRNYWEEEPTCFTTELPNFLGQSDTVTIMRHLTAKTKILETIKVFDPVTGELKASNSMTLKKIQSPVPVFTGAPTEESPAAAVEPEVQEECPAEVHTEVVSEIQKPLQGRESFLGSVPTGVEMEEKNVVASVAGSSTDRPPSHGSAFSDVSSGDLPKDMHQGADKVIMSTPSKTHHCRMSTASTEADISCFGTEARGHLRSASIEEEGLPPLPSMSPCCRMSTASTDDYSSCLSTARRSNRRRNSTASIASVREEDALPVPAGRPRRTSWSSSKTQEVCLLVPQDSMLTNLTIPLSIQSWDWPLSRQEKKSVVQFMKEQEIYLERDAHQEACAVACMTCDRLAAQRDEVLEEREEMAAERNELVAEIDELRTKLSFDGCS